MDKLPVDSDHAECRAVSAIALSFLHYVVMPYPIPHPKIEVKKGWVIMYSGAIYQVHDLLH